MSANEQADRCPTAAGYVTLKLLVLVTVPAAVVTKIGLVSAPVGTVVTICVAVSDTMVAAVPPKLTLVAPERLRPVMVTVVPAGPEVGVNPLIWGVTEVVIRPITLPAVNHMAPSGPAVMSMGLLTFWTM